MKRKTTTTSRPRIPGIACPHCLGRAIAYDSVQIDRITRDIRFVCQNADCGHTYVAQLAVYRTIRPSARPDPRVILPFGEWRSRPANDDNRPPANDDDGPPAAAVDADPMTG